MEIIKEIDKIINNFSELKNHTSEIDAIAQECIKTIQNGGKIMLCENGGSAADAQHLAAELVGKYKKERKALPAIALSTDTSILTAIGNDFSADKIFERQVDAIGKQDDFLIGITTSGNSENVINAFKCAKSKGIKTAAFTGEDGGKIKAFADFILKAPSDTTNNIQEMHIASGHLICGIIEEFFA